MTRIVYIIIGNRAEMRSFDSDDGLMAEIEIVPHSDGYITIGDETFPIRSGRATVDLSRLKEGEYTPILYRGSCVILEPIRRERSRLLFPGTPDSTIRSLLCRVESLENEAKTLRGVVNEMKSHTLKDVIF